MADVQTISLTLRGGTVVSVIKDSALHYVYAQLGATPAPDGVVPDPYPGAVTEDELDAAVAGKIAALFAAGTQTGIKFTYNEATGALSATVTATGATATIRTPEQYGAAGNGTTDDQAALVAMLAALQPGDVVRMDGQYRHSDVLTVPVADTTWFWTGALLATNRLAASLRISTAAAGTTMYGPRHIVDPWDGTGTARTGSDTSTAPFAIYDTSRITMVDAYSANSAQCGFYLSTVHGYRFVRPVVDRSFADGFHQTHNCEDGTVDDPTVMWPGDDGVAVVSYLTRGSGGAAVDPCRRIVVRRPVVRYTHARGLSAVGGTDITYLDVDVFHTRAGGVYFGAESGYNTHPAIRCVAKGGQVRHTGYPVPPSGSTTPDAGLDHGPLFLLSQQAATPVVDCGFMDIEVSDLGAVPFQYLRAITNNGATFTGCFYRRNVVSTGFEGRGGVSLQGSTAGVTYDSNVDNRAVLGQPRLSADVANTTTSTSNTGLGFSGVQPGTYEIEVNGYYTCAATSTGIQFNWGFSGSQSLFVCSFDVTTGSASSVRGITTATNTAFSAGTTSAGTTILPFTVRATIVVTATVVLDFKFASTVAGSAATVKAGSLARLTRVG